MSQIKCGTLDAVEANDDGVLFLGRVSLGRRLDGMLAFFEHPRRSTNPDSPEYLVKYKHSGRRDFVEVGAAWRKKSRDGATHFLTLSLDDPDWSSELNLSAFHEGTKAWAVVWSRPRGARVQGEAQAAAGA